MLSLGLIVSIIVTVGIALSIEDIDIEPLARRREIRSWADVSAEFATENADMLERAKRAREKGCTLRYVQRIECDPPAGKVPGHVRRCPHIIYCC